MYNQYNAQMAFHNGPPQYTNMSVPAQQMQPPVVPVEQQEPKFSHISFNDFPPQAPYSNDTNKPLREICLGQVPFFLDEITLTGFLRYLVPGANIHRTVVMEGHNGRRRGLCFVTLEDNGAVEKFFSFNKRVWFGEDRQSVLLAMNKAAVRSLDQLEAERRSHLTAKRRGDGLPMGAMTVEFSNSKPKKSKSSKNLALHHQAPSPSASGGKLKANWTSGVSQRLGATPDQRSNLSVTPRPDTDAREGDWSFDACGRVSSGGSTPAPATSQ